MSLPMQAPEAADNSTEIKAKQVFTPTTPAAFVADDGTLVLMGPSTSSAAFTGTGASANHLLWWIVTIIALVAIMCRLGKSVFAMHKPCTVFVDPSILWCPTSGVMNCEGLSLRSPCSSAATTSTWYRHMQTVVWRSAAPSCEEPSSRRRLMCRLTFTSFYLCSIAWAYSRNRSRRYMDLKEADNRMTEMAAQQRHDARV